MNKLDNKLTKKEKRNIRKNLVQFSRTSQNADSSNIFSFLFLSNGTRTLKSAGLAAMLIIPSVGFITAAENSLPNQGILYDFKVAVLEGTQSALQRETEAKVEFAVKQTETRLQEVVDLTKKGKLSKQAAEKVRENIEKHTQVALDGSQKVAIVDPKKSLSLQADLEDSLTVSSKVLSKTDSEPANEEALDELVAASRNQATQVKAVSLATESLLSQEEADTVRKELVLTELEEVSDKVGRLINALESTVSEKEKEIEDTENLAAAAIKEAQSDDTTEDALEILESSADAMANATAKAQAGNFKEALDELRTTGQDAEAAITLLESENEEATR